MGRGGKAVAAVIAIGIGAVACGSSSPSTPPTGPGGAYAVDSRCSPYTGDLCKSAQYPNFFQCDLKPGDACVAAPQPSPDPNQTVWCCAFPCARGAPAQDYRCVGGGALYVCTDAKFDPATYGCRKGPDQLTMCC